MFLFLDHFLYYYCIIIYVCICKGFILYSVQFLINRMKIVEAGKSNRFIWVVIVIFVRGSRNITVLFYRIIYCMDHHQSCRTLHPTSTTNNKLLTSSASTKRLSRKPSLLLLTSPKSKQQSNSETESQHTQFQSPTTSRFTRKAGPHQQSNSIELNNICYISPRNCKNVMSNFFNSYHPSQRNQGVRVSVERI